MSCYLPPRPNDLAPPGEENNGVWPQVALGDPFTGWGADSNRIAFAKYNRHIHSCAGDGSFLSYRLQVGDFVTAHDDILSAGTQIAQVEPNRLLLSRPALRTARASLVAPLGSIPNCDFVRGSCEVVRHPQDGFLAADHYSLLFERTWAWQHPQPLVGERYLVRLGSSRPWRLLQLGSFCSSGSGTLRLHSDDYSLQLQLGVSSTLLRQAVNRVVAPQQSLWLLLSSGHEVRNCHLQLEVRLLT
jgi:hypothetical protein